MQKIWAEQALTAEGWRANVLVEIGTAGVIERVTANSDAQGTRVATLLPAPSNLHSHSFQRAMAGMSERRGPEKRDTFWTWRKLMFAFLEALTPDDIESIAAFVQMEMLEAGYAAVGEFHYVHHQADGHPYDNVSELCERIAAATAQSGIGLTLLPVLYQFAGCDGAPLVAGQRRFGNGPDQFAKLFEGGQRAIKNLPSDTRLGVAPHSLRAVSRDGLAFASTLAPNQPLHMHLAEQTGEVDEIFAAYGQRPVEWLLDHFEVDDRWCLIHATQMNEAETARLAQTGAVVGLCPITESSLGDGIFNAVTYRNNGGRFGIGSDSNIRIALSEELRTLEYSQRLRERARAIFATSQTSTGRELFESAAQGAAQAVARNSGVIAPGHLADLLALDNTGPDLDGKQGDDVLDSYIFAGDDRMVGDVWSAGRHVVTNGRHINRHTLTERYRKTMRALKERM